MIQNEHAVSPVIGVMLMIVVTIIIAAVVSAFAANTDLAKRSGPTTTLDSEMIFAGAAQYVTVTDDVTVHHAEQAVAAVPEQTVDCDSQEADYWTVCDPYYDEHGWDLYEDGTADYVTIPATAAYTIPAYDSTLNYSAPYISNRDGLLFTSTGGDPIDLKDLEFGVRYHDLENTVSYTSTRSTAATYSYMTKLLNNWISQNVPADSDSITVSSSVSIPSEEELDAAMPTRYFIKINETSSDDTVIRPGDQFRVIMDNKKTTKAPYYYYWALGGLGIDLNPTETEWWLNYKPSGTTLAHGIFKFPNT